MKKRTLAAIAVLSVSVAAGGVVTAADQTETEAVQETATEALEGETEAVTESEEAESEAKGEAELSDQLFDFQMMIDGEVYTFPMSYEDFMTKGWELTDSSANVTEEDTLQPNQYGMAYFKKGEEECCIYILNLANSVKPVNECLAGGISLDNFSWAVEEGEVILPGGIKRGEATLEDIEAAYGTPTDVYEGDLYTKNTYQKSSGYESVELYVDKETGTLDEIGLKNFVEPEGFEAGEVSEEIPEEVAQYKAPEALGEALTDYQAEFDGVLYQLPAPVSAFIENGWQIDASRTDESVPAKSSGWVGLYKGGMNFHTLVRNDADYAAIPENCWVESLEAGGYGMEVPMKISGGIEIGMTEEDLTAVLDQSGVKYEKEEGSGYACYSAGEDAWNGVSIYVCTDEESSVYEPGAVYKIELEHEK